MSSRRIDVYCGSMKAGINDRNGLKAHEPEGRPFGRPFLHHRRNCPSRIDVGYPSGVTPMDRW